jgi:hypothetical protein
MNPKDLWSRYQESLCTAPSLDLTSTSAARR